MPRPPNQPGSRRAMRHRASIMIDPTAAHIISDAIFGAGSAARITGGRIYVETIRPIGEEGIAPAAMFADVENAMAEIGTVQSSSISTTRATFPQDQEQEAAE